MDHNVSQENPWRELGEVLRELHRSWPKDPITGENRMPEEFDPGSAAMFAAEEHKFDKEAFVRFCREWLGTEEPEHVEAVMEVVTREAKKPFNKDSWISDPKRCIHYLRRVAKLEKQRIDQKRDATPEEEVVTHPGDEALLGDEMLLGDKVLPGHDTEEDARGHNRERRRGRKLKTSTLSPHYAAMRYALEDLSQTGTLRDQRFARHILKDRWEIPDLSAVYGREQARGFKRKLERRLKKFSGISKKSG